MKDFSKYIIEKLKVSKNFYISPETIQELLDSVAGVYAVTNISADVSTGTIYLKYDYAEDKDGNLLCVIEYLDEPKYTELVTVILSDELFNKSVKKFKYFNDNVGLYECPENIVTGLTIDLSNTNDYAFINNVTEWYDQRQEIISKNSKNYRNFKDTIEGIKNKLS